MVKHMKTIKDKNYSFNHVKKRLTERYNLDITISEYDELCGVKMLGFINKETQKNPQKVYDILFKGKVIRVVFSEKRDLITTVLKIK